MKRRHLLLIPILLQIMTVASCLDFSLRLERNSTGFWNYDGSDYQKVINGTTVEVNQPPHHVHLNNATTYPTTWKLKDFTVSQQAKVTVVEPKPENRVIFVNITQVWPMIPQSNAAIKLTTTSPIAPPTIRGFPITTTPKVATTRATTIDTIPWRFQGFRPLYENRVRNNRLHTHKPGPNLYCLVRNCHKINHHLPFSGQDKSANGSGNSALIGGAVLLIVIMNHLVN